MRLATSRNNFYDRLSLATKETMKNFRTRMTSLYFTVVLVILVQIVFVLATPGLAEFFNEHTPESVSLYLTTTLVLLIDFLVLVPIMHQLVKNLHFLLRVYLDSQRKAVAAGTLRPRPKLTRLLRFVMTVNRWIFIVLFDFLALLLTPNNIDPWAHVLVAIAGVAIIATLEVIAYLRRS
jgi:CPA2 family monovalent cation:H+ antiporter-2